MVGLVGRERELDGVRAAVDRVAAGEGGILAVHGEAGIGKSELLAAAIEGMGPRFGDRLVVAEADELEANRAFGVLLRAFECSRTSAEPRRRVIAELVAQPIDAGFGLLGEGSPTRFAVQDELVELVVDTAATGPTVLVIDDLQWADAGTLGVLGAVGRRIARLPLLLIVALRPWPRSPQLDATLEQFDRHRCQTIRLDALSMSAVADLARQRLDAEPGPRLLAALEGGGGNPFFVCELLRADAHDGRLARTDDGAVELVGARLALPLRDRILRRLAALPEPVRELLVVASVAGSQFLLHDIATLVERPALDVAKDFDVAIKAGVVRPAGNLLAFHHDLVHEAVYADIPASTRSELHRRCARTLAERGSDPALAAPHLIAAAEVVTAIDLPWLRTAARHVSGRDPGVAAQLLERAVALAPRDAEIRLEYGRTLLWSGAFGAAVKVAHEADVLTGDDELKLQARSLTAEAAWMAGRTDEALTALTAAVDTPGIAADRAAALWAQVSSAALWSIDFDTCERAAANALRLAQAADAPLAACLAHGVLARLNVLRGDLDAAVAHGRTAVAMAGDDDAALRAVPKFYAGVALSHVDPDAGVELLVDGLAAAERNRLSWALPMYYWAIANANYDGGRWDETIAYWATGQQLSIDMGLVDEPSVTSFVGIVRYYRGEVAAARTLFEQALASAQGPGGRAGSMLFVTWLQAILVDHDGHPDQAADLLLDALDLVNALGVGNAPLCFVAEAVMWGTMAGRHDRAVVATEAIERVAELGGTVHQRAIARRCRATVDDDVDALVEAADMLLATNFRSDAVLAAEHAGIALIERDRKAEAVTMLEAALAISDAMATTLLSRRILASIRAAGGGRGARGARKRARHGWGSLTDTEALVMRYVAEGLTNAEVGKRLQISRRTVETHLVHVYAKVGLNSRASLISAYATRDQAVASV